MYLIELSDGWLDVSKLVAVRREDDRLVCVTAFRDLIYEHPNDIVSICDRMNLLTDLCNDLDAAQQSKADFLARR